MGIYPILVPERSIFYAYGLVRNCKTIFPTKCKTCLKFHSFRRVVSFTFQMQKDLIQLGSQFVKQTAACLPTCNVLEYFQKLRSNKLFQSVHVYGNVELVCISLEQNLNHLVKYTL